jgi:dihydrofolate reductase
MPRRKIIVQIATSADGFIARPDGDIEWLTERPHPKHMYGMTRFVRSIDTILFGRKTYEVGLQLGGTFDPDYRNYVFSRRPAPATAPKGVEFVNEPVAAFAKRLRKAKGKDIWMMGGGELIASFLDAGEIDAFMIAVMPVLIGEGIPLIAPRHRHVKLGLVSAKSYTDGVVMVHYEVKH